MSEKMKVKKTKEEILEILVVVLLGVTAVLTAWASWIGSLHGGNQATNYTKSNNISADGNARWNEASQLLAQDMRLWDQISSLQIDLAFAQEKENASEVERINWMLEKLYTDNVSDSLDQAITWAGEQEQYVSPFAMEGFIDSYYTDAQTVLLEAEKVLEQGQKDNQDGDAFGLVTVIYSIVLFLLGIAGSFKSLTNKYVLVAISIVGILLTTIYMVTIPLPTGFDIMSFFGK